MNKIEIIGLIASILIIFSMIFRTTNFKGTIYMRIINSIGSIFFVIYGLLLPAYSSAITNGVLFVLNIIYLIIEVKYNNKIKKLKDNEF